MQTSYALIAICVTWWHYCSNSLHALFISGMTSWHESTSCSINLPPRHHPYVDVTGISRDPQHSHLVQTNTWHKLTVVVAIHNTSSYKVFRGSCQVHHRSIQLLKSQTTDESQSFLNRCIATVISSIWASMFAAWTKCSLADIVWSHWRQWQFPAGDQSLQAFHFQQHLTRLIHISEEVERDTWFSNWCRALAKLAWIFWENLLSSSSSRPS